MPLKEDHSVEGVFTDQLIKEEIDIQARMWGDVSEQNRQHRELLHAGLAQLVLLNAKLNGASAEIAHEAGLEYYPIDWEGFRDYGSNIANLVVAAAFIRNEIKRRVLLEEETTRTKRDEPYKGALPYVSAEQAAAEQYRAVGAPAPED
jgi:hypothetical protein